MANDCGCTIVELMEDKQRQKLIDIKRYVTQEVGLPTLTDIMKELEKPDVIRANNWRSLSSTPT